ncbi:MAG: NAD(P)H-dependent oxidoreductase [Putridiphycobacter sp.]
MNNTIIQALNKRYATKVFDKTKKINQKDLDTIIEAYRLTPTSYGLQLMSLVIVEDPEKRMALLPHAYNQNQVVDASHLLVLCNPISFDEAHIEDYIMNISQTRNQDINSKQLVGFKTMLKNYREQTSTEDIEKWMTNQQYIALGNILTTCALLGIDTCPMEGFSNARFDEVLDLQKDGLKSSLIIPIGYASDNDPYRRHKKVRKSLEDLILIK